MFLGRVKFFVIRAEKKSAHVEDLVLKVTSTRKRDAERVSLDRVDAFLVSFYRSINHQQPSQENRLYFVSGWP